MLNLSISGYVYPLLGVLAVLVGIKIFKLPPQLPKFKPEELNESREYYRRMNRKGVHTPKHLAPVVEVGQAKEAPSWWGYYKAYEDQRNERTENCSVGNKVSDRESFKSLRN